MNPVAAPEGGIIRVVVVDDATVIRESLPALLPDLEFTGSFANVESLLRARPEADVVVLDLHLSNAGQPNARQGVAAIRAVARSRHSSALLARGNGTSGTGTPRKRQIGRQPSVMSSTSSRSAGNSRRTAALCAS